jgi:hypothetical protein
MVEPVIGYSEKDAKWFCALIFDDGSGFVGDGDSPNAARADMAERIRMAIGSEE